MVEPRKVLLHALSLAALALLCQCASSGPKLTRAITLEPGQLLRVSLMQVQSGQTLALQNASYSRPADVYSDEKSDRNVKVIDDGEMQQLLDVLAGQGMFERAAPLPAGNARELIAVQQGDQRWIWSRQVNNTADLEAFSTSRACIMGLYNATTAFHKANLSSKDLDAERRRIEQTSAEAKQKAQQAEPKGPPK